MFKRALAVIFGFIVAAVVASQSLGAQVFAQAQNVERAREVKAAASPAEVTVTLNEQFFNALLETIFTRMRAPSFPLSLAKNEFDKSSMKIWEPKAVNLSHSGLRREACESSVVLERETGGVRTAVRFENGRVAAPLAFRGSYSVALIGCVNFHGWADTIINLSFDRERQVLSARVTVVNIELSNIPSLASGVIIRLVQNSIDRRINPIEILQAAQLSTRLPITGTGGALRMRATEIRPEVTPGALSLHIYYEFAPAE